MEKAVGQRAVSYDKGADEHYAIISAFIKSIRGSDPDAALYWLARMEAGGEAPEFIARRLVISASEEVGVAASGGLTVAVSGMQAVKMIGPPECWLHLAHVTAYLARAPKSWAAYQGLGAARKLVAERPHYPVPAHLRNPTTALDRQLGHGRGTSMPRRRARRGGVPSARAQGRRDLHALGQRPGPLAARGLAQAPRRPSTISCSRPLVATAEPPSAVATPARSVKRPPASWTTTRAPRDPTARRPDPSRSRPRPRRRACTARSPQSPGSASTPRPAG